MMLEKGNMRKCIKEFRAEYLRLCNNPCENVGPNHKPMTDNKKSTIHTEKNLTIQEFKDCRERLKIIQKVTFEANNKIKT